MPKLRKLKFADFNAVIADIGELRSRGYDQGGAWNLSTMCEHMGQTLHAGLHGGVRPASWLMRATLMRALFETMIATGWMPSGAPTIPELTPGEHEHDDSEPIDACLALLVEARDHNGPIPPSPVMTGLTLAKWKCLQRIHCGHHLAFLKARAVS